MKINKSQGQSFSRVGLFLQRSMFIHKQLYVLLFRATSKESIKVVIMDEEDNLFNKTTNVSISKYFKVYKHHIDCVLRYLCLDYVTYIRLQCLFLYNCHICMFSNFLILISFACVCVCMW